MWADQELVLFNIWYWNFKAAMQWIDKDNYLKKKKKRNLLFWQGLGCQITAGTLPFCFFITVGVFEGFFLRLNKNFYLDFFHYK